MLNKLIRTTRVAASSQTKLFINRHFSIQSATTSSDRQWNAIYDGKIDGGQVADDAVECLVIHPVTYPNHGSSIETSLASEALGLARSLNWAVVEGPNKQDQPQIEEQIEPDIDPELGGGRRPPKTFSVQENRKSLKRENITDGDYVYTPAGINGVYFKGGIIADLADESDEFIQANDWKNDSLAASCVIKCRSISGTTFFTKGILSDIGFYIKENEHINVLFINTTLTSMQQKKLEKRLNDMICGRDDRVRRYYLKSVQKEHDLSPTEIDSETATEVDLSRGDLDSLRNSR